MVSMDLICSLFTSITLPLFTIRSDAPSLSISIAIIIVLIVCIVFLYCFGYAFPSRGADKAAHHHIGH
jgi:ABC-type antimicrobial peptide transport system permease subunit